MSRDHVVEPYLSLHFARAKAKEIGGEVIAREVKSGQLQYLVLGDARASDRKLYVVGRSNTHGYADEIDLRVWRAPLEYYADDSILFVDQAGVFKREYLGTFTKGEL
jgi:hypothetical protein